MTPVLSAEEVVRLEDLIEKAGTSKAELPHEHRNHQRPCRVAAHASAAHQAERLSP